VTGLVVEAGIHVTHRIGAVGPGISRHLCPHSPQWGIYYPFLFRQMHFNLPSTFLPVAADAEFVAQVCYDCAVLAEGGLRQS
jgi:hypothetical protein